MHIDDLVRPWCVICGRPATNKHHHPPKGLGGIGKKGIEPPVISLCGGGNVCGCHGEVHKHNLEVRCINHVWQWRRRGGDWQPCIEEMKW